MTEFKNLNHCVKNKIVTQIQLKVWKRISIKQKIKLASKNWLVSEMLAIYIKVQKLRIRAQVKVKLVIRNIRLAILK